MFNWPIDTGWIPYIPTGDYFQDNLNRAQYLVNPLESWAMLGPGNSDEQVRDIQRQELLYPSASVDFPTGLSYLQSLASIQPGIDTWAHINQTNVDPAQELHLRPDGIITTEIRKPLGQATSGGFSFSDALRDIAFNALTAGNSSLYNAITSDIEGGANKAAIIGDVAFDPLTAGGLNAITHLMSDNLDLPDTLREKAPVIGATIASAYNPLLAGAGYAAGAKIGGQFWDNPAGTTLGAAAVTAPALVGSAMFSGVQSSDGSLMDLLTSPEMGELEFNFSGLGLGDWYGNLNSAYKGFNTFANIMGLNGEGRKAKNTIPQFQDVNPRPIESSYFDADRPYTPDDLIMAGEYLGSTMPGYIPSKASKAKGAGIDQYISGYNQVSSYDPAMLQDITSNPENMLYS